MSSVTVTSENGVLQHSSTFHTDVTSSVTHWSLPSVISRIKFHFWLIKPPECMGSFFRLCVSSSHIDKNYTHSNVGNVMAIVLCLLHVPWKYSVEPALNFVMCVLVCCPAENKKKWIFPSYHSRSFVAEFMLTHNSLHTNHHLALQLVEQNVIIVEWTTVYDTCN
jgi:hypothetical protein